jgi:hypothetical protein
VLPLSKVLDNDRRNIPDLTESTPLFALGKNRHSPTPENLVHENSDYIAIFVPNVLILTIDIIRLQILHGSFRILIGRPLRNSLLNRFSTLFKKYLYSFFLLPQAVR